MQAMTSGRDWISAWPDLLAFGLGLGVAWFARWDTTDLVWSLWLSSLVVGYASIVWIVTASLREFTVNAARDPAPGHTGKKLAVGSLFGVGALFMLAFFTVHFGGFHLGHSVFLNSFFPVVEDTQQASPFPGFALYGEVLQRYWIFLPVAFIAERAAFRDTPAVKDDGSVTVEAIAARKARGAKGGMDGGALFAPYRNVVRMHLLIFFFAFASFTKLDNFAVYAVVYAVYFFPWSMLRRRATN